MKNPSLGITVCHQSASLVMPNCDPQDGFFYPTLTLMIDSYSLSVSLSCQYQQINMYVTRIFNVFKGDLLCKDFLGVHNIPMKSAIMSIMYNPKQLH